jgi:hypothetical protein
LYPLSRQKLVKEPTSPHARLSQKKNTMFGCLALIPRATLRLGFE